MKKRVLITGGTGLIGRRTVLALKQAGYYVIALSRAAAQDGADLTIQCDLLDDRSTTHAIAQAEATHLVHLAWSASSCISHADGQFNAANFKLQSDTLVVVVCLPLVFLVANTRGIPC